MIFQESETVGLKSIVVDDIKKEIVAFANSEGGRLYIGVRDDGTVVGLDDPDGAALQVSNMVRDGIKPDLTMFMHYETLNEGGEQIVAVDIQQGTERPYYIAKKGLRPEGVYVRQGYSSVPATNTAIRRMIKETDGDHFEEMRSLEQDLTFGAAKKEFSERNILLGTAQMKTLGIMTRDGVYTNLGLILSDQCVHTIKVAVFGGTTQNEYKDRREFSGSLFRQMEDIYAYIDRFNLLVHREYAFRASALISIYTDRIEFTSIGGLVGGVTLQDVLMGISVCRNVKLANVFYRLELIEAYGTGIQKIMEAYRGTGKVPKLETSDNVFKIILPNLNVYTEQSGSEADRRSGDAQEDVIALAQKQGTFTRKDVEQILGIGQTTCGRLLRQMVEKGQIVQEGKSRNTHYRLSS